MEGRAMAATRYVIIGGSGAGMAAAATIRQHDNKGRITVVSEELDAPYFRPMIPFIINRKKKAEDLFLEDRGPYRLAGVDVTCGTRVVQVDVQNCLVHTETGTTLPYDRLLLATGSRPHMPAEIEGLDHVGVFAPRTLGDARRIAAQVEQSKHAVMLGGGILNLKISFALLECGLRVSLVVHSPEVLSQLMEAADTPLIRQALDRAGLEIKTGRSARKILADEKGVTGVLLDNGEEMTCDLICVGKGVRPNTAWLNCPEITIREGIVVDEYTRTSAENVYAAGDVAVTFDPITGAPMITGLWTNAAEMGRCAGANMAGVKKAYGGTFGILNATQVAQMPFVSMGLVHSAGTEYETYSTTTRDSHRKLVFSPDGDYLIGAVFIGDISKAGLYRAVIREKMKVEGMKKQIIGHQLHYGHLLRNKRDAAI